MRDIVFNVGANSATSLARIGRIVGMVLTVEGVGINVEIIRIGRSEFGFLEAKDGGVEFRKSLFDFMPILGKAVDIPLEDLDLMIVIWDIRREPGHVVLSGVLCGVC